MRAIPGASPLLDISYPRMNQNMDNSQSKRPLPDSLTKKTIRSSSGTTLMVGWGRPLKDQAQGWHPDFNDGIRQNIRPFLFAGDVGKKGAGLFRAAPLKLKDKDRGTEPIRSKAEYPWFWCEEDPGTDPPGGKNFVGNRWNDVHLTLAPKKEASS
jgi:hypothetical protein